MDQRVSRVRTRWVLGTTASGGIDGASGSEILAEYGSSSRNGSSRPTEPTSSTGLTSPNFACSNGTSGQSASTATGVVTEDPVDSGASTAYPWRLARSAVSRAAMGTRSSVGSSGTSGVSGTAAAVSVRPTGAGTARPTVDTASVVPTMNAARDCAARLAGNRTGVRPVAHDRSSMTTQSAIQAHTDQASTMAIPATQRAAPCGVSLRSKTPTRPAGSTVTPCENSTPPSSISARGIPTTNAVRTVAAVATFTGRQRSVATG